MKKVLMLSCVMLLMIGCGKNTTSSATGVDGSELSSEAASTGESSVILTDDVVAYYDSTTKVIIYYDTITNSAVDTVFHVTVNPGNNVAGDSTANEIVDSETKVVIDTIRVTIVDTVIVGVEAPSSAALNLSSEIESVNSQSSDSEVSAGQSVGAQSSAESGLINDSVVVDGFDIPPHKEEMPPVLKTEGNDTLVLPYEREFDYGLDDVSGEKKVVLDNFDDDDHQNNLAGALASYNGQNHTRGGGFWYVYTGDNGTITSYGVNITSYNVIDAVEAGYLYVEMETGSGVEGYAGVGTNILYEETPLDLTGLTGVRMRVKGTGTVKCYLEAENRPAGEWGKHGKDVTLSSTWQTVEIPVGDFVGDQYSGIDGETLLSSNGITQISKLVFQVKEGNSANFYIDDVELLGLTLDDFEWTGERDPEFVFDPDNSLLDDTIATYLDFNNLPSTTFPAMQGDGAPSLTETGNPNWLHREGLRLYDTQGNVVRLTGVNWFGLETKTMMFHGLWSRDYRSMLKQIKDEGFNCVRIPWSNETLVQSDPEDLEITFTGTDSYYDAGSMNAPLRYKNAFEVMTIVVEAARDMGLKIILDNHSKVSDGYLLEGLWYTDGVSEQQWIEDWKMVATHFKNNDAVVAMDLKNEPHFEASWGNSHPLTDWNKAAERCGNAVLSVNPNVLIMVAGVEATNGNDSQPWERYWWGGNLQGVRTNPIQLADDSKLVYTPHEYGPEVHLQDWFRDARFPNNLEHIWNDRYGFIVNENLGHLFIGEFGIKDNITNSVSNVWFNTFIDYMKERKDGYSFTFWAWNPNSSDTGGMLANDWLSINNWKLDKVKPLLAPLIGNNNGI